MVPKRTTAGWSQEERKKHYSVLLQKAGQKGDESDQPIEKLAKE